MNYFVQILLCIKKCIAANVAIKNKLHSPEVGWLLYSPTKSKIL